MDLSNLPAGTPVWAVTIAAIITMLFTFTERAAKIKGPLGAAARWWNTRQVRQVENKQNVDAMVEELVNSRVDSRVKGLADTVAALEKQVATLRTDLDVERDARRRERAELVADHQAELSRLRSDHQDELSRLREDDQSKYRYILYLSSRLREYRLWASDHGYELPPPKIPSYFDWVREQEGAMRRPRDPPDDIQ